MVSRGILCCGRRTRRAAHSMLAAMELIAGDTPIGGLACVTPVDAAVAMASLATCQLARIGSMKGGLPLRTRDRVTAVFTTAGRPFRL
jgi:hypothetical protein